MLPFIALSNPNASSIRLPRACLECEGKWVEEPWRHQRSNLLINTVDDNISQCEQSSHCLCSHLPGAGKRLSECKWCLNKHAQVFAGLRSCTCLHPSTGMFPLPQTVFPFAGGEQGTGLQVLPDKDLEQAGDHDDHPARGNHPGHRDTDWHRRQHPQHHRSVLYHWGLASSCSALSSPCTFPRVVLARAAIPADTQIQQLLIDSLGTPGNSLFSKQ